MANAGYEVLEFRAVIEGELTHLYVRISDADDGTLIGGWYHKVLPKSEPAMPAFEESFRTAEYLNWDRGAPK